MMPDYRVEMDEKSLARFIFALSLEDDGKALRRDFIREVRKVAAPAKDAAAASILAMSTKSGDDAADGRSLRQGIARSLAIRVRTATSGKRMPGVAIRAKKTPTLRGFEMAPRRTNRAKGWRHPLFGNREKWYGQEGKPGWFDDTIVRFRPQVLRAAKEVMDQMAARISRRTRG